MLDYLFLGLIIVVLISVIGVLLHKLNKNKEKNVEISHLTNNIVYGNKNYIKKDNNISIMFDKKSIDDIKGNTYIEIQLDQPNPVLSNVVFSGLELATIMALNPNGLFSASVTPQLLTQFTDGSFSTMIHESGRIIHHGSFHKISTTVFTPIIAMKLMAMASGQYYSNGITKQINNIEKKIDKIIIFQDREKKAELDSALFLLNELCKTKSPQNEDLVQLKILEVKVRSIYEQYLDHLKNIDTSYFTKNDIELFTPDSLKKLNNIETETGFSFAIYMVIESDVLLHKIKIIELILNIRLNENNNDRIEHILQLYETIKNWQKSDFYCSNAKENINEYYRKVLKKVEMIKRNAERNSSKEQCLEFKKMVEQNNKDLIDYVIQRVPMYILKNNFNEIMETPLEVLCYVDKNNKNKFYVRQ
jgi:hypothetical protein